MNNKDFYKRREKFRKQDLKHRRKIKRLFDELRETINKIGGYS